MLELQGVCFSKDNKKILDDINIKLDNNKFYCLTGPNGSGKSTLAKVIMGLEKVDSGKIYFNNIDITDLSIDERAQLGIGYAFQQAVCFKGITVHNLLEIASGQKLDRKDACSLLSKVGLCALEYIDREVNKTLSGGELKRIEIVTLLARNPKLAIFDEPEAGIDLWSFKSLNEVFKEVQSSSKEITFVISHQEKILDIADEILLMDKGKITKLDSNNTIISCHKGCCKGVGINE